MIGMLKKMRAYLLTKRVVKDQAGISVVEFGLIAPMFLGFMMAVFDLGFGIYTKAVLQGAIEEAARTASLENDTWTAIQERVNKQVLSVIPGSSSETNISFTLDRKYYEDYDDLTLPEDFTDANNNGTRDANECYVDRNANRQYDTNVGLSGKGGAQDVVQIKAIVSYKRVFPLWSLVGQPDTQLIQASTYLRNQPFSGQSARVGVRICT
jgi:hypothetical protein